MGKPGKPRSGSMGVWPRKRAKNTTARVRSVPTIKEAKLITFPVYKAGMTHVLMIGTDKNRRSSGIEESIPVTILECPPVKIASVRLYAKSGLSEIVKNQINFKVDKEVSKATNVSKNVAKIKTVEDLSKIDLSQYSNLTIQVYTTPKSIDLKKKPDLLEVDLGGNLQEKLDFVKAHIDKPISFNEVFKEGQVVDAHAITKGKGFQGPVKRFGIGLKGHKSEKGVRAVGSLGGWSGQGHVMYRVAHAGQMGFHQRTQFNNTIIKISDKPEEINPKGGLINYGLVKSNYLLIKGSIQGAKKRLILLSEPVRLTRQQTHTSESIKHISTESQQRR